jgi:hypothetical protein
MPEEKDIEELRKELEDYYGTAMVSGMPMAVIDLSRVSEMSDEEIEESKNSAEDNAGKGSQ